MKNARRYYNVVIVVECAALRRFVVVAVVVVAALLLLPPRGVDAGDNDAHQTALTNAAKKLNSVVADIKTHIGNKNDTLYKFLEKNADSDNTGVAERQLLVVGVGKSLDICTGKNIRIIYIFLLQKYSNKDHILFRQ